MMPFFLGIFLLFTSRTLAAYDLLNNELLPGCPFLHGDRHGQSLELLSKVIRGHLQTKVEGNRQCEAAFRTVVNNFDSIDHLMSTNVNPSLPYELPNHLLQQRISQLQLDLLAMSPTTPGYADIAAEIFRNNQLVLSNTINAKVKRQQFNQGRTNATLASVFQHLDNSINVLARLDPTCMMQLGDWHVVLPVLLNMASSLSAFAGTTPFASMGAGLKILSSITAILRDLRAKLAIRSLVRQRNNKILACTYYVIQNTACDYRRQLRLSKDYPRIKNILEQRYGEGETKTFDEFYYLRQQVASFEPIFFDISAMGSAVTLDVDVMTKYFRAKRSQPDTILSSDTIGPPPADADNEPGTDEKRQAWLIKIKARGISFQERDQQGNLKTLKAQILEAMTDIINKQAEIKSVESLVTQIRSFIDLKHRLDEDPSILARVRRFKVYFNRVLNQEIVTTPNVGLVMSALRIIEALEYFLSIKIDTFYPRVLAADDLAVGTRTVGILGRSPLPGVETSLSPVSLPQTEEQRLQSFEAYYRAVNNAGRMLFEKMSEGAVAQVDQQTVLTIGNIVQERLDRVFALIENEFYRQEAQSKEGDPAAPPRYSTYLRDRSMLVDVAMSYDAVSGSGTTFRGEDVALALAALENGFHQEIRTMILDAMKQKSTFLPDLQGDTAAHLCALFAPSLREGKLDTWHGKSLISKCQALYQELKLYGVFKQSTFPIVWEDPCYYFTYQNLLETHRILYDRMVRQGFFGSLNDERARESLLPRLPSGA